MIIVIHGPKGCGKSHNARKLADYNGCIHIHDMTGEPAPSLGALMQMPRGDHLVLTLPEEAEEMKSSYWRAPGGVKLIPYEIAAKRAGIQSGKKA